MSRFRGQSSTFLAVFAALPLVAVAGMVGGPDNSHDVAFIHSLAAVRIAYPGLTRPAITITFIGGAPALVTIMLVAAAGLAWAKRWRDVVTLSAIVIGGRITVELLKICINRPRPQFGPYPVEINSLSFPSGHASNSMITFLALALIAAPDQRRRTAVAGAILAAIAIGATRPLLGVHWPTDVVGGWAFGIGWVIAFVELSRGWRAEPK